MKIIEILKNHKWAVALAVLAGIIIALPQLYFRYDYQDVYQGIDPTLTGAEFFYWGRVQEVRDGYPSLGNVWFAEYKDRPYIQPPLGAITVAYLGKAFSLGINDTIILARFLFPALILLAIYGFVYLLIRKKYIALVASTGIVLADNIFARSFIEGILLRGEISNYEALGYARPIIPQMSSLLFFGFLLFFWLFLTKKRWIFGILSGILLGLSFYVFFYTWSLIFAFMGILGLFFLVKKEWLDLKKILFVAAIALIVAVPYILNTFQSMQYPEYLESCQRMGLIESHKPTPASLIPAALIIFLIIFPRAWKKRYLFCSALLIAPLVALNQQIITGMVLINAHYHWYYSKPLAFIFLTICFFYLLEKIISSQVLKKIIIGALLATFILNGLIIDSVDYSFRIKLDQYSISDQRYGPILKWLNTHTQKDDVVFANRTLSILISVYTPLNLGSGKWSNQYLIPQRELLERMFLNYRLRGVKAEDASKIFLEEKVNISWLIFGEYYRQKLGDYVLTPDEVIQPFIQDYQNFSKIPIEKLFQKFKIKYVIWDQKKDPEWSLEQYPFLKEVHQENKIKIYQVI